MALTQHYALIHFWYWKYWWLDIIMHFSGGVVIALISYALGARRTGILLGVLAVGILWELFEFGIGVSVTEPNFIPDSMLDLVMDMLGAAVVYGILGWWSPQLPLPLSAEHGASPDQTSSSPQP